MPATFRMEARKSSRTGTRTYKTPPPLRFKTVKDAKQHIKASKMKVTSHSQHTRGMRIDVVDPTGKARTISIERSKPKEEDQE